MSAQERESTLSNPYSAPPQRNPRSLQFALFVTGGLWFLAATILSGRAAQGIADRFNLPSIEGLLEQGFLVFLLLLGFTMIFGMMRRPGGMRAANQLPRRATTRQELLRGVAMGWAMLLVAVLPMMLTGALHLNFSFLPTSWGLTVVAIATMAFSTLALEIAFRGFLFSRLIDAFGETGATTILSAVYAFLSIYRPNSTPLSVLVTFLAGVVFSLAYLRTHALWFGWGLHFGWVAATAILLGLPVAGYTTWNNVILTTAFGPDWLTGGGYGPEGALFTLVVFFGAIFVLYRLTRDYAWNYTHPPIVAAGYKVTIAPPAAHTAMESAAVPAPLVQILGATPTASSTLPVIDEHLRREAERSAGE